jgi:transposase
LVAGGGGQFVGAGGFWGAKTGPSPTDRRKNGSKHHVATDAHGIPLAATVTAANDHDVTQLLPVIDAIPPVSGKVGRPRHRPDLVQGDRAYDSQPHRVALRRRGIRPMLARRCTAHGSGLGVFRWVVERTHSWLHQNRRLRVRYERRADIPEAFLLLGCIKVCHDCLKASFC